MITDMIRLSIFRYETPTSTIVRTSSTQKIRK